MMALLLNMRSLMQDFSPTLQTLIMIARNNGFSLKNLSLEDLGIENKILYLIFNNSQNNF